MPKIPEAHSNHWTTNTTTCVSHHPHSIPNAPCVLYKCLIIPPQFKGQILQWCSRLLYNQALFVADSLYHKRFSIDGRQLNLEVFDPCSQVCVYSFIRATLIWAPPQGNTLADIPTSYGKCVLCSNGIYDLSLKLGIQCAAFESRASRLTAAASGTFYFSSCCFTLISKTRETGIRLCCS